MQPLNSVTLASIIIYVELYCFSSDNPLKLRGFKAPVSEDVTDIETLEQFSTSQFEQTESTLAELESITQRIDIDRGQLEQ